MKQGYTVCVSEEARREHESGPKPAKRKTACPCEAKPKPAAAGETAEGEKQTKEGEKQW